MSERVEKIAKALCDIFDADPTRAVVSSPGGEPAFAWHYYVPAAEAALKVIEEGADQPRLP